MVMVSLSDLNWVHVLVAAVVGMLLGWAWYSPVLFGNQWMRAVGMTSKDIAASGKSPIPYLKAMLGHLITAIALAEVVFAFGAFSLWEGVQVGLLVSLGVLGALQLVHLGFRGSKTLIFINGAYDIVVVVMMSGLLAMWH